MRSLVILGSVQVATSFSLNALVTPRRQQVSCRAEPEEAVTEVEAAAVEAVEASTADDEKKGKRGSKENAKALDEFVEGETYDGTVVGVAAYGAFVDIGAVADGLVHISELSDRFVNDVASLVSVGDAVKVRVMKYDTAKQQLSLSMKPEAAKGGGGGGGGGRGRGPNRAAKLEALKQFEGADPKAEIDGTVTSIQPWGAFIAVAEGIDGLVHISRIADERVEDVNEFLTVGQAVKVRVIDVDMDKATLALAMDTYRERAPYQGGGDDDEQRRSPRFRAAGGGDDDGRQRAPRMSRSEPGDDIWETKPSEAFDWKAALTEAQAMVSVEDSDVAAFSVDADGRLVLN